MLEVATTCLLPYHTGIRDHLKREERDVWQWYASHRVRAEQAEALQFELLKATYRLKPDSEARLYEAAGSVAAELQVDAPLTLYQAQSPEGLNASIAYAPDAIHLVLHGDIASKLSPTELRALFAHEMGHAVLWGACDGELMIAAEIIAALTHDRRADASHFATARLFDLYQEIFCDRMALHACGEPADVIASLVKTTTGLEHVDADAYLEQAAQILAQGDIRAEGLSHPELYIRAHAVDLWRRQGTDANAEITRLIEGEPALDHLDLLAQQVVASRTRRLLDTILAPAWTRTDSLLAHARLFFDDYTPPGKAPEAAALATDLALGDEALQKYYCHTLLDFATVDRELEPASLAHALAVADLVGLHAGFYEIARKELRLRKRQLEQLDKNRDKLVAEAARAAGETR